VAQLSQACEVIPFGPSLKDLAIPDTIDCDVLGIHGLPGRQIRTHRTALRSAEMVPHRDFFALSKYIEDCFLGVGKRLVFAAKKTQKVRAASHGGFTCGNAVPHKVRRDKGIEPSPVLAVDRIDKGLNGLFRIHENVSRSKISDRSDIYFG